MHIVWIGCKNIFLVLFNIFKIVIEMKRINQSTKLVNMKSIGKSFEKRDLYIMQVECCLVIVN